MEAHSIPVEILLEIFSQLELKPYIICHGVCKDWCRLLPLADIHPIRRRLFELYQRMINTPNFLNTRSWIVENLQPFDRQAHVNALLAQHPAIPEEYRIWVLEWPARAVIACIWPGLPFMLSHSHAPKRRHGVNWLAYKRDCPELMAPIFKQKRHEARFTPALLIWRLSYYTDWLSLDIDEQALFDRVYITDIWEGDNPAAIPEREPWTEEDLASHQISSTTFLPHSEVALNGFHPDWISYLEYHWAFTVEHISSTTMSYSSQQDYPIPEQEMTTRFRQHAPQTRPTCPWDLRHLHTSYLNFS